MSKNHSNKARQEKYGKNISSVQTYTHTLETHTVVNLGDKIKSSSRLKRGLIICMKRDLNIWNE